MREDINYLREKRDEDKDYTEKRFNALTASTQQRFDALDTKLDSKFAAKWVERAVYAIIIIVLGTVIKVGIPKIFNSPVAQAEVSQR